MIVQKVKFIYFLSKQVIRYRTCFCYICDFLKPFLRFVILHQRGKKLYSPPESKQCFWRLLLFFITSKESLIILKHGKNLNCLKIIIENFIIKIKCRFLKKWNVIWLRKNSATGNFFLYFLYSKLHRTKFVIVYLEISKVHRIILNFYSFYKKKKIGEGVFGVAILLFTTLFLNLQNYILNQNNKKLG